MPLKSKTSILDIEPSSETTHAPLTLSELRLMDIGQMSTTGALKYLVHHGLLRDGREEHEDRDYAIVCPSCRGSPSMTLVSSKDRSDGWMWRCPKCKKREKSIRDDSIFAGSKLDIKTYLGLLYMWCRDYDNQAAMHELRLSNHTVIDIYARFRQVCVEYSYNAPKIGGPDIIVEFDQTCLVHQKHHRGAPKPGTHAWYCVGVERGPRGRCFAVQVNNCDNGTIDWVLKNYLAVGTTLITDEWRAHPGIVRRLPEMNLSHFMLKHKETLARWVNIEDETLADSLGIEMNSRGNRWLRVHTNTVEGLNAHLKHKLKRIRGTNLRYVQGYLSEAVFRMNARATLQQPIDAFTDLIAFEPVQLREDTNAEEPEPSEDDEEAPEDPSWQLLDPDDESDNAPEDAEEVPDEQEEGEEPAED